MYHLEFNYHGPGAKRTQFTENFYLDLTNLATAEARARSLGAILAPMHGAQTKLIDCRIHNLEPHKQRKGGLVPFADDASVSSSEGTDSDYPTTALAILLSAADGTKTRQWLKGLPDSVVKKGVKVSDATWDPKFTTFKDYLTTPGNLIKMRVQTATPDKWRVDGLTEAGVLTIPPNDLVDDETVILTGRKIPKAFRGEHKIIKVDDSHIKLYGVPVQPGFQFSGKADVRRVAYDLLVISDVLIVDATSHKVHKEKK